MEKYTWSRLDSAEEKIIAKLKIQWEKLSKMRYKEKKDKKKMAVSHGGIISDNWTLKGDRDS